VEAHKNDHASAEDRKRVEAFLQAIQESVQTAKSLGVKIAAGYDASSAERQGRNADELVALTKRGMTPTEAIQAATINAAELMNWQDRVGALEPEHYADVIAVDGNPLVDITILQRVKFVMKGGKIVKDAISAAPGR
jgi:imidazolonepropionase-like amidohydrolase